MKPYLQLLEHLLDNAEQQKDRTGTGTVGILGHQMRFDLSQGLPVVTTKKIHLKSVIHELLWMLSGSTNNNDLKENGVTIWDEWALEDGDLGPIYGEQWRRWPATHVSEDGSVQINYIDQISEALRLLKDKPFSRRNIITAWNPATLPDESLHPHENVRQGKQSLASCHCLFQLKNINGRLSGLLFQRSVDTFLGLPFNIVSYALLIHMFAQQADLEVGELIWTGGDTHLYLNHLEMAQEQIQRDPRPLPKLELRKANSIFDYKFEDFKIIGYDPHPAIKAPVSV